MKKIKIGDKSFEMYQSWNELPLGNFQRMAPLMVKNDMTPMNRLLITISSITEPELNKEDLENFTFDELSIITEWAKWALDLTEIIGSWEDKEGGMIYFEIDGQRYAFDNTFQISIRQMLDLDHLTSERNTDDETHNKWFGKAVDEKELTDRKFWSNLHRIIAILIRPAKKRNRLKAFAYKSALKTLFRKAKQTVKSEYLDLVINFEVEKYDQSTVEERAKLFQKRLSAADGAMLAFFLSSLEEQFRKITQDSGPVVAEEKMKQNSAENGAGIQPSGNIAMVTS